MLSNAQKILIKAKRVLAENAGRDGNFYNNKKYVRMAGKTAWEGVVVGLSESLKIQKESGLKVYQKILAQNPYYLKLFDNAYETLCWTLGGDGNLDVVIIEEGIRVARELINWSDKLSRGYDIKDNVHEVSEKMSALIEEQYNDPILYEEGFFVSWEDKVRLQQKVDGMITALDEENAKKAQKV
jgi:hypothetical protein